MDASRELLLPLSPVAIPADDIGNNFAAGSLSSFNAPCAETAMLTLTNARSEPAGPLRGLDVASLAITPASDGLAMDLTMLSLTEQDREGNLFIS